MKSFIVHVPVVEEGITNPEKFVGAAFLIFLIN